MDIGLLAQIATVAWPILSAPIVVLWKRLDKMNAQLQSTYSKEETQEQIELRQRPIKDALDRNTVACEAMMKLLDEVRIELAEARGNGKEKSGS